jgi:hypothetical protein
MREILPPFPLYAFTVKGNIVVFSLLFGHEKEEAEIKEYGTNKGMKKDE